MPQSFVLGMDFGGTKMALATANQKGVILEREDVPTLPDAYKAVTRALAVGHDLVERTKEIHGGALARVGVATMGITQDNEVLFAPNVAGWGALSLPRILRESFRDVPVAIANDVKSAAVAELKWGALKGVDPGLFINLGTGIAAALCIGGRVIQGAHGASGEIAYNPLGEADQRGVNSGVAPLEQRVGGGWIKRHACRERDVEMSAGDIFRQAQTDPVMHDWVEPILHTLSFQLTHLVIALDPARIVIGGGLSQMSDFIFPYLLQRFHEFVPFPPELVVSHFNRDAGLLGAVGLAWDKQGGFII